MYRQLHTASRKSCPRQVQDNIAYAQISAGSLPLNSCEMEVSKGAGFETLVRDTTLL